MGLTINGVNYDSYLKKGTLDHVNVLRSEPDTLTFNLIPGAPVPTSGAAVEFTLPDGTLLFGGEVTGNPGAPVGFRSIGYQVQCSDWRNRANRKTVNARYQSTTGGAIIVDLFAQLAPEFDTSLVDLGGPLIKAVRFKDTDNTRLTDVLDKLAGYTGYIWDITPDKKVIWQAPGTTVCPFSLTDASRNFQSLTVNVIREGLANRVIVVGGNMPDSKLTTDYWTGDGLTTRFRLSGTPATLDTYVLLQEDFASLDTSKWAVTSPDNPSPPAGHIASDGFLFTTLMQGAALAESGWLQVVGGDGTWGDVRCQAQVPSDRGKDGGRFEFDVYAEDATGHGRVGLWDPNAQDSLSGEQYGFLFDAGTIKPSEGGTAKTALASVTYTAGKTVRCRVMPKSTGGATYWVNTDDTGDTGLPADQRVPWRPSQWVKLYDSTAGSLTQFTVTPIFNQDFNGRVDRVRQYNPLLGVTLTVGGVAKVVGMLHVDEDSGCDALLGTDAGGVYVLAFFGDTTPASSAAVQLSFYNAIPIKLQVQDDASIAACKAIENPTNDPSGSDGIHESVISDQTITSLDLAITRGAAELAVTANPEVQLTFATREQGARSGQVITAALTADASGRDLAGSYLIQQVETKSLGDGVNYEATITASSKLKGLTDYLLDLLKRGQQMATTDDDTSPIVTIVSGSDTLALTDSGSVGGPSVKTTDTLSVTDSGSVTSGPVGPFIVGPDEDYTFTRASTANDPYTGAQVASGVPDYSTVSGVTGVQVREACTNLLTANQSSVETDLTGFAAYNGDETLSRDATVFWTGVASLKVVCPGSAANEGVQFGSGDAPAITGGQTYTLSVYVKGSGDITIYLGDGTANTMQSVTLTNTFQRVTITRTMAAGATNALLYILTTSTQALTFWVDGLQIEQSAYATSWQIGGTPRAAESLTIPTPGVISDTEWTALFLVHYDATTRDALFLDTYGPGQSFNTDNRIFAGINGGNSPTVAIYSSSGNYADATQISATESLPTGFYVVGIRYKASLLDLSLNGSSIASAVPKNPYAPTGLDWFIGGTPLSSVWNNLIVGIKCSNAWLSDAELAAITPSNWPDPKTAPITGQTYAVNYSGTLEPQYTPWAVVGLSAVAAD